MPPAPVAAEEAPSAKAGALADVDFEGATSAQAGSAIADAVAFGELPPLASSAKAETHVAARVVPSLKEQHYSEVATLTAQGWPNLDAARAKAPRSPYRISGPRPGQRTDMDDMMHALPPPPTMQSAAEANALHERRLREQAERRLGWPSA